MEATGWLFLAATTDCLELGADSDHQWSCFLLVERMARRIDLANWAYQHYWSSCHCHLSHFLLKWSHQFDWMTLINLFRSLGLAFFDLVYFWEPRDSISEHSIYSQSRLRSDFPSLLSDFGSPNDGLCLLRCLNEIVSGSLTSEKAFQPCLRLICWVGRSGHRLSF